MSMFNILVKPHFLAPFLLRLINWGQKDDPKQLYPLLGRMRYVWMDEEGNICLMLKDGGNSWSDQKEQINAQIEGHESFVSMTEEDVYLYPKFRPLYDCHYDRNDDEDKTFDRLVNALPELLEKESFEYFGEIYPPLTKHPMDIFNEGIKRMESGEVIPEVEKFTEGFITMIEKVEHDKAVNEELKKEGITPNEEGGIKVFGIARDGSITEGDLPESLK
jgi:hypothetical protein